MSSSWLPQWPEGAILSSFGWSENRRAGQIDGLPDGAREVFVLREVEGVSTAEAAESLGVSADVVKTRLSRAKAALRRALMEKADATAPEAFRVYRPRCDRVVARILSIVGGVQ